jgi:two-component system response regulator PilR (NtrC family)
MSQERTTFHAGIPRSSQVLIVDDDLTSLDLLQRGLRNSYGYEVATAGSARDALVIAQACRFDVMVVDLRLPDMSGIEMVRTLIDQYGPLSFVLVTGFADVPTTVEAMKLGAFTVVEKPVDIDDLGRLIECALTHARCPAKRDAMARHFESTERGADRYMHAADNTRARTNDVAPASPDTPAARSLCCNTTVIGGGYEDAPRPPSGGTGARPRFRHDELFALAQSVIEADLYRADLHLGVVAKALHVSRWRLSRAFSACGAHFRSCLRRARMRRAGELLRQGHSVSIKEVGIDVGYLYAADFTKHFRQYWGMSPTEFRKKAAASPGHSRS